MRISDWSSDVCSSDLLIAATIPTGTIQPISIILSPLCAGRSAKLFDLVGKARVAARVHQFDVGEPAVDVAELGAHFGGRTARIGPYALPAFGVFGRRVMLERLLGREPAGGDMPKEVPAHCAQCLSQHGTHAPPNVQ